MWPGLTPAGVAHSWLLGTLVYAAFGPGGYLLVCLYFIFGSAVSPCNKSNTLSTDKAQQALIDV